MIHHIDHYQLRADTSRETIETIVRGSRGMLLKIPEVLNVKSGRNLDPASPWNIFVAYDVESREKLRAAQDDPHHFKYLETLIRPHCAAELSLDFEMDPSRDLKYS